MMEDDSWWTPRRAKLFEDILSAMEDAKEADPETGEMIVLAYSAATNIIRLFEEQFPIVKKRLDSIEQTSPSKIRSFI